MAPATRTYLEFLIWRAKGARRRVLRKFDAKVSRAMVRMATYVPRQRLAKIGPVQLLIDTSVHGHAVTHETVWIKTQGVGGYLARIPVHSPQAKSREFLEIRFLPGIAHLARVATIELVTSAELNAERFHQPVGRFKGYGAFDHSLFFDLKLRSVDGIAFPTIGPKRWGLPSSREQQRERIHRYTQSEPGFAALVECLGPNNSQDAWHLWTAEKHGIYAYLTMDFRFIRAIKAQSNSAPIRALTTRVMLPSDFAAEFGLFPLHPNILSYENADCFVHPQLNMPNDKRRPGNRYR